MISGTTLRLVWPQWQGAGTTSVDAEIDDLPPESARRSYAMGTQVLELMLGPHNGPVAHVPVPDTDDPVVTDGIESKAIVLQQLRDALALIDKHQPERIITLGGDCAVSAAPFAAMAHRYGDDLAVIWVDSHPDLDTPDTAYSGYHAMVLAHLIGKGDPETLALLPSTIDPRNVAFAGIHAWEDDVTSHITDWGITAYSPDDLRSTSEPLLEWLRSTGCSKVAIHFDVDVVDSNDIVLGLGRVPNGLTLEQVSRVVSDIANVSDVVALTIAEYIPRQVIRLQQALRDFPLL